MERSERGTSFFPRRGTKDHEERLFLSAEGRRGAGTRPAPTVVCGGGRCVRVDESLGEIGGGGRLWLCGGAPAGSGGGDGSICVRIGGREVCVWADWRQFWRAWGRTDGVWRGFGVWGASGGQGYTAAARWTRFGCYMLFGCLCCLSSPSPSAGSGCPRRRTLRRAGFSLPVQGSGDLGCPILADLLPLGCELLFKQRQVFRLLLQLCQ